MYWSNVMKKVLIYDGDCDLCSRFINLVVKVNKNDDLYITDFNSEWFKQLPFNIDAESVSYISKDKIYNKSNAVIHMLMDANRLFTPIVILKIIPKIFRDKLYDRLANNRYKYKSACSVKSVKFYRMYLK